jgi:hypothetical protein
MTKPAILGLCAMAAGCAAAGPGPVANDQYAPAGASAEQAQCFNSRFIEGFSEVDRDTVRIRVSRNDYYNLNVSAACTDLDWTDRLAVIARNGAFLCVGADRDARRPLLRPQHRTLAATARRRHDALHACGIGPAKLSRGT